MRSVRVRSTFTLAMAVLAVACGEDPSLHVTVDHPDELAIARTVVSVFESPTLTCDDIAFARITPDELDAVLVAERTSGPAGAEGDLAGLSRTDRKLVVARGYDATGVWASAGCQQVDVVEEREEVEIVTMPTVNAARVAELPSMDDPQLVRLSTIDVLGNAVANRRVSWTVYGPAGAEAMYPANVTSVSDGVWEPLTPTCTQDDGTVALHPPPPRTVGGYVVQPRAEWAIQPPSQYSGFATSFTPLELEWTRPQRRLCAIRQQGTTRRLVCLHDTRAVDYELVITGDDAALVERDQRTLLGDPIGLVTLPRSSTSTDRDVYMVTQNGTYVGLFGAPAPANPTPCATCATVEDVLALPACGQQSRPRVLLRTATTGAGQLKLMNADGTGLQDVPATLSGGLGVELDNAGCVTRLQPEAGTEAVRQVFTFHVGTRVGNELFATNTRVAYSCSASECAANDLVAAGAGVGFGSAENAESRMIATSVDATGVVLSQVVMAAFTSSRDRFIERDRYPSAGLPSLMVTGTFDGDTAMDVFWTIGGRRAGTSFQVAYGRTIGAAPVGALSSLQPVSVGQLLAGDLDGNGVDEIVIVGDFTVGPLTVTGVVVLPMHRPARLVTVPVDPACAP